MELKHSISDYTEAEFLEFVKKICRAEGATEEDDNKLVREFERLTEHPDGSDLIYYPRDDREIVLKGLSRKLKNGELLTVSQDLNRAEI